MKFGKGVAPLVGAWIEIFSGLPKRTEGVVAPLVGAWIEIQTLRTESRGILVAPLVGAWIEMSMYLDCDGETPSLLSWERGLKLYLRPIMTQITPVAPLVGAWIEITGGGQGERHRSGRSSRGSVD